MLTPLLQLFGGQMDAGEQLSTKLRWASEPELRGIPHARVLPEMATQRGLLAPPLRRLAAQLAPRQVVLDAGGMGQCGPNAVALLLDY